MACLLGLTANRQPPTAPHELLTKRHWPLIPMSHESEPIVIVTTGGTIDKAYFDALSSYQVGETVVARLLNIAHVTHPYRIVELLRKDSLELTDEDRATLRETIENAASSRIIVTHGTDTMTDSAKVLASVTNKTIVLTGALAPARFSESDATFNLGMAFAAVQTLPAGVYITMNGRVFRGDEVRKDRKQSRFVPNGE
jgi:L-asparaginase